MPTGERHQAKPMTSAEKWSLYLSVGTFCVVVLSSILTFVKFLAFDRQLLVLSQAKEQSEVRRMETPVLLTSLSPNRYQVEGDDTLSYATFNLCFKNIGTAPVRLGTVALMVSEAVPSDSLKNKLLQSKPHPPPLAGFSATESQGTRPIIVSYSGDIHSAVPCECQWTPTNLIKPLALKINYTLQPNEETSVPLDYIVEGCPTPKWYSIAAKISPPDKNAAWEERTVTSQIDVGPFPQHGSRTVAYATASYTGDKEVPPQPIRNQIPSSAIEVITPK